MGALPVTNPGPDLVLVYAISELVVRGDLFQISVLIGPLICGIWGRLPRG